MKTNRFQNTIFFKGPKLQNLIMFNNILKTNTITHNLKLKKVLKSFFININYYNFGKYLFINHSKTITHIYYKQYYKIDTFLL